MAALPKEAISKMKAALGLDRAIRLYSAAAPMSKKVLEFFARLDLEIWEIYGMSETTGPHNVNCGLAGGYKLGTNGRPMIGARTKLVKVHADGEGPCIRINGEFLYNSRTICFLLHPGGRK